MNTRMLLLATTLASAITSSRSWADLVISNDATQNMSCSAGACTPTYKDAVLNVGELESLLAVSDVMVNTSYIVGKHRKKYVGSLELRSPLSWSAASTLTLGSDTYYFNAIEAAISVPAGAGLISARTTDFANGVVVTFASTDSIFSISGQPYALVADFPTLASGIAANPKGFFALADNYDAANDQFQNPPIENFAGVFRGLGHTISNLTIPKGRKLCEGMMAVNQGGVEHLSLANLVVSLDKKVRYVGGIAGCNHGYLNDVAVSGQINGNDASDAGGVAGINYQSLTAARASATVTGGQAGGLVGENNKSIQDSSATGPVRGMINSGGLAGGNNDQIETSFATGSVSGEKNNTGGFAGSNRGEIRESYAMGSVSGGSGMAGGFVGYNVGSVQQAYSVGTVTGGKKYTGGFAGYDANESINAAYWDVDTSGISDPGKGAGFPKYDPGITGITSAKLQSGVPFGFSKRHWGSDPNINNGYPYLLANPPQ